MPRNRMGNGMYRGTNARARQVTVIHAKSAPTPYQKRVFVRVGTCRPWQCGNTSSDQIMRIFGLIREICAMRRVLPQTATSAPPN